MRSRVRTGDLKSARETGSKIARIASEGPLVLLLVRETNLLIEKLRSVCRLHFSLLTKFEYLRLFGRKT